jgi:hypothetical protein
VGDCSRPRLPKKRGRSRLSGSSRFGSLGVLAKPMRPAGSGNGECWCRQRNRVDRGRQSGREEQRRDKHHPSMASSQASETKAACRQRLFGRGPDSAGVTEAFAAPRLSRCSRTSSRQANLCPPKRTRPQSPAALRRR